MSLHKINTPSSRKSPKYYNEMVQYRGNYFKLKDDKRFRPIYSSNGKYTKAFKEAYRQGLISDRKELTHVYNEKTNRFVSKADMYDKRSKVPRLKKKFSKLFNIDDGVFSHKRTFYNHISYGVYEFRGNKVKINNKFVTKLRLVHKTNRYMNFKTDRPFNIENCIVVSRDEYMETRYLKTIQNMFPDKNVYDTIDDVLTSHPNTIHYKGKWGEPASLQIKDYEVIHISGYSSDIMDNSLKDLKNLKMFNAQFMIDNPHINKKFVDSGRGACVPEILQQIYCNPKLKRPLKLTLQDIANILKHWMYEEKPEEDANIYGGFDSFEIEEFCKSFGIPMYALDYNEKCFYKYQPERSKRNKFLPALCYIACNDHMYICNDNKFVKSVAAKNNESIKYHNKKDDKQKEVFQLQDSDVIVKDISLMDRLITYVKDTNTIPDTKKILCHNGIIKSMTIDDIRYVSNPEVDTVKTNLKIFERMFDTKLPFNNQSMLRLAELTFKELFPYHNKSVFNSQVKKHLKANGGIVQDFATNFEDFSFAVDINKCRTSCLRDNVLGEYKRFSVLDKIELYDKKPLTNGFYYISTSNSFPSRGSGWYSNGFINYLKSNGIKYKILYQLKASYSYPTDYLKKLYDAFIQFEDFKSMSNRFIGKLATLKTTNSKISFEKNFDTCCYWYFKEQNVNKDVVISPVEDEEQNTLFYQIETKFSKELHKNDLPIYNQILENEYVKMYELHKQVQLIHKRARLISCRTDELTYSSFMINKIKQELSNLYSTDHGGYKEGNVRIVKEMPFDWVANKEIVNIKFNNWNIITEDMFDGFDDIAKAVIDKNTSMLINGFAGTGKTTLLRDYLIPELDKKGLKYERLAPTNMASCQLKGSTIHKFLAIDEELNVCQKYIKKLVSLDYVIVDEISMVNSDILGLFQLCKQNSTKTKFIFVGDFRQLPPVGEETKDFEHSYIMRWLCDNNKLELNVNKRSDSVMTDLSLKVFDTGVVNKEDYGQFDRWDTDIHLTFSNKTRRYINQMLMQKYKTDNSVVIQATDEDYYENKYCQDVILSVGTPVMACHNLKKYNIYNNKFYTVDSFKDEWINLKDEDGEILPWTAQTFNKMFVVCYGMTCHKSQGRTIREKFAIWDSHVVNKVSNRFAKRWLYTAITRTTDKNNILIVENNSKTKNTYSEDFITKKIEGYTRQDSVKNRKCDLTVEQVRDLIERDENCCFDCGMTLNTDTLTLDRIDNAMGHSHKNLRLCCFDCNRQKAVYQ